MIDNIVRMIIENKRLDGSEEDYQHWVERVNKYKEWKSKMKVTETKPGMQLDVRDTEFIWCKGTVELKITTNKHDPLLYIHYEGWNRKYDEYIS